MRAVARIVFVLFCLIAALSGADRAWSQGRAQALPIRIGAFLSVTGDGAYVGAPQLATLQLYVELINRQGGVLNRPLELVYYDVGIDTKTAQTAVRRLIDQDQVDIIIGGSTTGAAMAVLPIVEQAQIPYIALAGSGALINPVYPWVFKASPTDRLACAKIFEDMKKRGISQIALVTGDSGFAVSMKEQCASVAVEYGIRFVGSQMYPSQTRRVAEPLQRLVGLPGIQAVLAIDFGSAPPYLVQAYRKSGFKVPLYQTHAQVSDDFIDLAGDAAEGVRMPVPLLTVSGELPDGDPHRRILRAYVDAYQRKWDIAPNFYGAYAHDALLMAVAAIVRAGNADNIAIRDSIEQTDGFIGASGIFRMSEQDHMGLDLSSFRMAEIRGGTWVLIE
jgi:branched-chain amino acid transport system substrate-binding protein